MDANKQMVNLVDKFVADVTELAKKLALDALTQQFGTVSMPSQTVVSMPMTQNANGFARFVKDNTKKLKKTAKKTAKKVIKGVKKQAKEARKDVKTDAKNEARRAWRIRQKIRNGTPIEKLRDDEREFIAAYNAKNPES